MNDLIKELNIDETLTKPVRKTVRKKYNRIIDSIPLVKNYNMMADVLHLPTNKNGYKYLLVVVDLASSEFDIEPMKTEDSKETLKALKVMFRRKHISKPYASIRTDGGASFKKDFHKYLVDNIILHKTGLAGRHTQSSAVENLNRTLGRLFNGYMNSIELETNNTYREWTDIVSLVRNKLNKIRKKDRSKNNPVTDVKAVPNITQPSKLNVGDLVHRKLDKPQNALSHTLSSDVFREGDYRWAKLPVKITEILFYPGDVTYRYLLNNIKNASFTENQLMLAKDQETGEQSVIRKILDRKFFDKEKHYLIWMHGELKKDAGWYARNELLKTVDKRFLINFDKEFDKKKKKK